MNVADAGSTNPELLKLLADMGQSEAWAEFMSRYTPMIRSICSGWGLQKDDIDDVQQQVMLRLVNTFLTETNRIKVSFRGFLRRVIANEIFKFLEAKNRLGPVGSLDSFIIDEFTSRSSDFEADLEWIETSILNQLEAIQRVLSNVRCRVQKTTWNSFWMITIQGISCKEVALELGVPYLTAYQQNQRVLEMIRQEVELYYD